MKNFRSAATAAALVASTVGLSKAEAATIVVDYTNFVGNGRDFHTYAPDTTNGITTTAGAEKQWRLITQPSPDYYGDSGLLLGVQAGNNVGQLNFTGALMNSISLEVYANLRNLAQPYDATYSFTGLLNGVAVAGCSSNGTVAASNNNAAASIIGLSCSSAFDEVAFDVKSKDYFNVNKAIITTANAVPEPATWGMMAVGFAAVGGALRRRHKPAKVTFG